MLTLQQIREIIDLLAADVSDLQTTFWNKFGKKQYWNISVKDLQLLVMEFRESFTKRFEDTTSDPTVASADPNYLLPPPDSMLHRYTTALCHIIYYWQNELLLDHYLYEIYPKIHQAITLFEKYLMENSMHALQASCDFDQNIDLLNVKSKEQNLMLHKLSEVQRESKTLERENQRLQQMLKQYENIKAQLTAVTTILRLYRENALNEQITLPALDCHLNELMQIWAYTANLSQPIPIEAHSPESAAAASEVCTTKQTTENLKWLKREYFTFPHREALKAQTKAYHKKTDIERQNESSQHTIRCMTLNLFDNVFRKEKNDGSEFNEVFVQDKLNALLNSYLLSPAGNIIVRAVYLICAINKITPSYNGCTDILKAKARHLQRLYREVETNSAVNLQTLVEKDLRLKINNNPLERQLFFAIHDTIEYWNKMAQTCHIRAYYHPEIYEAIQKFYFYVFVVGAIANRDYYALSVKLRQDTIFTEENDSAQCYVAIGERNESLKLQGRLHAQLRVEQKFDASITTLFRKREEARTEEPANVIRALTPCIISIDDKLIAAKRFSMFPPPPASVPEPNRDNRPHV